VAAVDPEAADVVLMTELHRLLSHFILPRRVRRPAQTIERQKQRADQEEQGNDAAARIAIGTRREDLRHLSRLHESKLTDRLAGLRLARIALEAASDGGDSLRTARQKYQTAERSVKDEAGPVLPILRPNPGAARGRSRS